MLLNTSQENLFYFVRAKTEHKLKCVLASLVVSKRIPVSLSKERNLVGWILDACSYKC